MSIFMGVIESGLLMSAGEAVVNSARKGARLASLGGSTMGTNTSTGSTEVNYRVRQYLTTALSQLETPADGIQPGKGA